MAQKTTTMWRAGVRHPKDWSHWDWSSEYPSLKKLLASMQKYISEHPGVVVCFRSRTVALP